MIYSVSYWVASERYWQFAGEWDNLADAQARYSLLEKSGHLVRIKGRAK